MNTGSIRTRVTLVTLSLLVIVLAIVVTAVTLAYRSSLQSDLRGQLTAAGTAVRRAGSADAAKALVRGLALEGIATNISRAGEPLPPGKGAPGLVPIKPGTSITSAASLLVLDEVLPDGTRVTFSASSSRVSRAVTRLLIVELVVAALALLVAALLLLRGTRTVLRPLEQVSETAARIAAGDRELRLHPSRTDTELGAMAAAFDQMVDALEAAVTKAQSTESAMRRFLADASHELRTPIAALQASVETLLREQPERPGRDGLEAALARDVSRLGRLVDDLLSLTRLEGEDRIPDQSVDLAELAEQAVEQARLVAPRPTILIHGHEAKVRGDAGGLLRVLRNLLDNAIAAVPPTGHIEMTVDRSGDYVEVHATDDGPGIPDEDRERVFERFVRLSPSQKPGTGLGLAIARHIARQHGGDLTCNQAQQGASFTLRLPAYPSETM